MEPKFSIIVPHYDGCISDEVFIRGMNCLKDQTFKNFEVLVYHDGPLSRPLPQIDVPNCKIRILNKRYNNWGHSSRDLGIKEATGEYIVHFNPDNVLYPFALEKIHEKLLEQHDLYTNDGIVIFPILMRGMRSNGIFVAREANPNQFFIFTGFPVKKYNIDCMQLVMKRQLWLKHGGWFNKTEQSDGDMYPEFVAKYGARFCSFILGEHW